MQQEKSRPDIIKIFAEAFGAVVIIISLICAVRMNITGRTLWLDEAMLAMSFCKRSFFEMFDPPLDWNQSAPVGYVFIVKLLTMMFGTSEHVLRAFSLISYALMLFVFYLISRDCIESGYPLLCTAGVSSVEFLLKYSNMLKPYMFDTLCVLLVIYLYLLYTEKRIRTWVVAVIYAVLMWCANPVAFVAGGCIAAEFCFGVAKRDTGRVRSALIIGGSLVASFVALYFFWLRPTIEDTNLSEFWEGEEFPLLLTSTAALEKFFDSVRFVCQGIGRLWTVIVVLAVAGIILNIFIWKKELPWMVFFSMALTLIASNMGFFPVSDRLFTFAIPILIFAAILTIHLVLPMVFGDGPGRYVIPALFFCFTISGTGISEYCTGEDYIKGEESKEAVTYLKENLKSGDEVFVYYPAIPIFGYEMGYDTDSVCGYDHNVHYGTGFFYDEDDMATEDIDWIESRDETYLFFTHVVKYQPIKPLLKILKKKGKITEVLPPYLYIYERT